MMRYYLQWAIAYAFAIASAILAGAYGFLSATGFYAYAKLGILCLVAFGGCHGPAYVVKLHRSVGWPGSSLAALATAACLLVTLWGGLGTIAGGGAELRAERAKAASDAVRDRATLKRLEGERDALPHARPAATVQSDLFTARASLLYKASECEPERIGGPKARDHCKLYRQLEGELASSDAAARLESEAAVVRQRLERAPPEVEPDPQAAAFSRLTTLSVELSAALYAFAASVGLELMGMVAMMVAWSERRELPKVSANRGDVQPARESPLLIEKPKKTTALSLTSRPKEITPAPRSNIIPIPRVTVFGSISKFTLACLGPAASERLELRAVFTRYQGWCKENGLTAAPLEKFLDEIESVCRKVDIGIEIAGDKVYCLGVKLSA